MQGNKVIDLKSETGVQIMSSTIQICPVKLFWACSDALMLCVRDIDFWFVVPVNQGQVSFNLTVSPEMAPDIQIVAYAILPSENVIAHSADFSTEKCFTNVVSKY